MSYSSKWANQKIYVFRVDETALPMVIQQLASSTEFYCSNLYHATVGKEIYFHGKHINANRGGFIVKLSNDERRAFLLRNSKKKN